MIFILGLDGLESNFVEQWNLKNLRQHQHGKIAVPIDFEAKIPKTATVWYQFLTGVEHDASHRQMRECWHFLRKLKKLAEQFSFNLSFGLSEKAFKTMQFPPLKHPTFLDGVDSVKINAPYYNFDSTEIDKVFSGLNNGSFTVYVTKYLFHNIYEKKKQCIFKRLQQLDGADVVFVYLHFPDIMQHLCYPYPSQIKWHYENLDKFVLKLKKELPRNVTFIIVSDHGFSFKKKTHSNHGFYSCNKPLTPRPERITDFFSIIRRMNHN